MYLHEPEFKELDPDKKDGIWGDKIISRLRRDWRPLVNEKVAEDRRRLLYSTYDMEKIKRMFKNDEFRNNTEFIPIAVMEKLYNIILSEIVKAGIMVQIHAVDPSAIDERMEDTTLLKNRRMVEETMGDLNAGIGLPQNYKVDSDEFHGNIDEFDEMGLDDRDLEDVNFFIKTRFRLRHELRGQLAINSVMTYNKFEDLIEYFVKDILSQKKICFQQYVDRSTGEIKFRHLYAENTYWIPGRKRDTTDAICKGFRESITIRELISFVGNSFDWDRDWIYLMNACNYANGTPYTGILHGGRMWGVHDENFPYRSVELSTFLNYKVSLSYIEWKSFDSETYKRDKRTGISIPTNYSWVPDEDSGYERSCDYYETTYCAYFLEVGSTTQRIYKFGPLYHQTVEGAEDEYSNFSIAIIQEEGKPPVEIAQPYFTMYNALFYKMLWCIEAATPKKTFYSAETIIELAMLMKDQTTAQGAMMRSNTGGTKTGMKESDVLKVVELLERNLIGLYTYPKVNGQIVGGGGMPIHESAGGLDPVFAAFQTVLDWAELQLSEKMGITQLRQAVTPNENDPYHLSLESMEQSRNATGFIGRMIIRAMLQGATTTMLHIQDIVKVKDTLAYKWLRNLLTRDTLKSFEDLKGFAAHRYGMFLKAFNVQGEKDKLEQDVRVAIQNKEISYEQGMMITGIDDRRQATVILAYFKNKNEKKLLQQRQQEQQATAALEDKKHQNLMDEIKATGFLANQKADIEGRWRFQGIKYATDGRSQIKNTQVNAEAPKQEDKKNAAIQIAQAKSDLEQQKSLETSTDTGAAQ